MIVERPAYRLELLPDGRRAVLSAPDGDHWLTLSLLAAFDRVDVVDETLELATTVDGDAVTVDRTSTAWTGAGVTLRCLDDRLELRSWVEGTGRLADVHLLGGRLVPPAPAANGFFPTGTSFTTLFSPNPGDPSKLTRGADESAVIGVNGDGHLGRGHWFFTPAPLFLAFARDDREWLGLSLDAPVAELTFVACEHRPADRAFHLVLAHEGHTAVAGRHAAPVVVLTPGLASPYDGIRAQRERIGPPVAERERPAWWRRSIFCGWGSQSHVAAVDGGRVADHATQERYDGFLAALEQQGVVPGTVVVDDNWQSTYGRNEPDPSKWPDLRAWIDERHERGQRVLLWWKAWDPEGLPEELCIRRPDGAPVAVDPTNPRTRELLREVMHDLCGPGGLDADGLKTDFTARTPSGHALAASGAGWGIALLHDLLSLVYAHVKEAKPEALVMTQTPHPSFADVCDMLRLNDTLRLDDPGAIPAGALVPQMAFRAAVARAAQPDVLIDTDDWAMPDKRTWRDYLDAKPSLGVPSLYYATHIDRSGEALDDDDYAAIRRVFAEADGR